MDLVDHPLAPKDQVCHRWVLMCSLQKIPSNDVNMNLDLLFEQISLQLDFVAHHIHMCFRARMSESRIWLHTPDCKVVDEVKISWKT